MRFHKPNSNSIKIAGHYNESTEQDFTPLAFTPFIVPVLSITIIKLSVIWVN
jgi:hypothetical protein